MSDLITDAMVEAAARADHATYDAEADWDSIDDRTRDVWREGARAALEAFAPLIAAKAWEEGYQACQNRPRVDGYLINRANPYQTRAARADEIATRDV